MRLRRNIILGYCLSFCVIILSISPIYGRSIEPGEFNKITAQLKSTDNVVQSETVNVTDDNMDNSRLEKNQNQESILNQVNVQTTEEATTVDEIISTKLQKSQITEKVTKLNETVDNEMKQDFQTTTEKIENQLTTLHTLTEDSKVVSEPTTESNNKFSEKQEKILLNDAEIIHKPPSLQSNEEILIDFKPVSEQKNKNQTEHNVITEILIAEKDHKTDDQNEKVNKTMNSTESSDKVTLYDQVKEDDEKESQPDQIKVIIKREQSDKDYLEDYYMDSSEELYPKDIDMDYKDIDFDDIDYKDFDYENIDYKDIDYEDVDYKDDDYKDIDYKDIDYKEIDYKDIDYKDVDYKDIDCKDIDYKGIIKQQIEKSEKNTPTSNVRYQNANGKTQKEYYLKVSGLDDPSEEYQDKETIFLDDQSETGNLAKEKFIAKTAIKLLQKQNAFKPNKSDYGNFEQFLSGSKGPIHMGNSENTKEEDLWEDQFLEAVLKDEVGTYSTINKNIQKRNEGNARRSPHYQGKYKQGRKPNVKQPEDDDYSSEDDEDEIQPDNYEPENYSDDSTGRKTSKSGKSSPNKYQSQNRFNDKRPQRIDDELEDSFETTDTDPVPFDDYQNKKNNRKPSNRFNEHTLKRPADKPNPRSEGISSPEFGHRKTGNKKFSDSKSNQRPHEESKKKSIQPPRKPYSPQTENYQNRKNDLGRPQKPLPEYSKDSAPITEPPNYVNGENPQADGMPAQPNLDDILYLELPPEDLVIPIDGYQHPAITNVASKKVIGQNQAADSPIDQDNSEENIRKPVEQNRHAAVHNRRQENRSQKKYTEDYPTVEEDELDRPKDVNIRNSRQDKHRKKSKNGRKMNEDIEPIPDAAFLINYEEPPPPTMYKNNEDIAELPSFNQRKSPTQTPQVQNKKKGNRKVRPNTEKYPVKDEEQKNHDLKYGGPKQVLKRLNENSSRRLRGRSRSDVRDPRRRAVSNNFDDDHADGDDDVSSENEQIIPNKKSKTKKPLYNGNNNEQKHRKPSQKSSKKISEQDEYNEASTEEVNYRHEKSKHRKKVDNGKKQGRKSATVEQLNSGEDEDYDEGFDDVPNGPPNVDSNLMPPVLFIDEATGTYTNDYYNFDKAAALPVNQFEMGNLYPQQNDWYNRFDEPKDDEDYLDDGSEPVGVQDFMLQMVPNS